MRILLFTGKGGVGKTTLAAATAAHLTRAGSKTLVVSTDPAHSVADALNVAVGHEPAEVDARDAGGQQLPGLYAAQIGTRDLVDETWRELREHVRTVLTGAGVTELDAEELTVLPGLEDLLALTEVDRLARSGQWDTVIVDCGPTAETLRLLALPDALATYLERLFPTHRRVVRGVLAGLAGGDPQRWDAVADALGRLAERLENLRTMLAGENTAVRLVLTPESVVAAETRRTLTALALHGVTVDGLIANRVVPDPGAARGKPADWLRARRREQDAVLTTLRDSVDLPLRSVTHASGEPIGTAALLELAAELYGADDPLHGADGGPMMTVRGGGTALDSEYVLHVALPLHTDAELDLARIGDELAVTVDGRRRLLALPAVLRRCQVTGAEAGDDGLAVHFRPDPSRWMRGGT